MPVNPHPFLFSAMKDFVETDIYSLSKEEARHEVAIFREDVLKPLLHIEALYKEHCWDLDLEDAALTEDEVWLEEKAQT
jgi:hypothetical protein